MVFLRMFIILLCFIGFALPSVAWDDRDEPYDRHGNPQYRYEGFSGTKYQYDLSDPSDRLDYKLDLDAQMRDRMNLDPGIKLDRGLGQYGGGAED